MKPAPTELANYLTQRRQLKWSDGYTITTITGQTLRFCTTTRSFFAVPPGEVVPRYFEAGRVLISGLRYRCGVGMDVDEQTVKFEVKDPTVLVDQQLFTTALRIGLFDGGTIRRDRFFFTEWDQPTVGGITFFAGRVSVIDSIEYMSASGKVKSDLVLLNANSPRNVFLPGCLNTLYDGLCALLKDDFAVQGTVEADSTTSIINWSGSMAGEYDEGTVTFETGPNVGVSRTIRQSTSGALILSIPLEFTPTVMDDFVAFPGCNKTMPRCEDLQSRSMVDFRERYRGFPYVPPPETAV